MLPSFRRRFMSGWGARLLRRISTTPSMAATRRQPLSNGFGARTPASSPIPGSRPVLPRIRLMSRGTDRRSFRWRIFSAKIARWIRWRAVLRRSPGFLSAIPICSSWTNIRYTITLIETMCLCRFASPVRNVRPWWRLSSRRLASSCQLRQMRPEPRPKHLRSIRLQTIRLTTPLSRSAN